MNFREIEAEFPELSTLPTFSTDWYRRYQALHLQKYPEADSVTRANLAMFVRIAEENAS